MPPPLRRSPVPPRSASAVNPIAPGYPCATLGGVTTTAIRFGRDVPDDRELRLCGDISGGKRAIELGVSRDQNSIAFALAGAKAIAVDPSGDAIAAIRGAATKAEVSVECHISSSTFRSPVVYVTKYMSLASNRLSDYTFLETNQHCGDSVIHLLFLN